MFVLKGHTGKIGVVHALAISPGGMTAALGGESGAIVVWDLE